jgi:YD repeat-containing protein
VRCFRAGKEEKRRLDTRRLSTKATAQSTLTYTWDAAGNLASMKSSTLDAC